MAAKELQTRRRNGRPRAWSTIVTLAMATISFVGLGIGIAWTQHWIGPKPSTGPRPEPGLSILAEGVSSATPVNLSGASISVLSIVPSTIGSNPTISNTTQEVLLFQGITNGDGLASGYLGAAFSTVDQQWLGLISPLTTSVSLTVVGSYFATASNGSAELMYSAFNSVDYNPRTPPTTIALGIYFDLSKPSAVVPALTPVPMGGVGPLTTTCPPPSGPVITTDYDATVTGPFPIMMVNNTERSSNGEPFVAFSDSIASGTFQLDFTETEAESTGSISMSSGTTWSGSAPGSFTGAASAALAESSASIGLIYLEDVSINVLRQTYTYTYYLGTHCTATKESYQYTWTSIVNVDSSDFTFMGQAANSAYGQLLTDLNRQSSAGTVGNLSTSSGDSQYWVDMQNQASGYTNAVDLLNEVVGAAAYFETALDIGLAVADLAGLCGFVCEESDVADTISIVGDALGFAATVIDAMSSISYQIQLTTTVDETIMTANDGGFSFQVIGAGQQTTLTTSDGSTSASMPATVTAWP